MKLLLCHARNFILFAGLMFSVSSVHATLLTDLQALNLDAGNLQTRLQATSLNADSVCAPLVEINQDARALVNSVTRIEDSLIAPLQVDTDTLAALDQLGSTSMGLASEALRLSVDLNGLSALMQALTLKDGITAMLQLSDDIGAMADRIGEMSDNILVMADNIGLMADRILVTQELQSQNYALTTNSILQTQSNVLTLVSVIEDSTYDLSIAGLIAEGGLLAARMQAVELHPLTMASQLRNVADDVEIFLADVKNLNSIINSDATASTMTISYDSLIQLGNLSLMMNSLAIAVDGYVLSIGSLNAITSDPTLASSMQSMLQLSADIGVMANRILEMADQILLMAGNTGLQADQVLLTQQAMNVNIATTQGSILAAQQMAIGLIASRDL